ncbi:UNVERIFIED_CONTAM: hypothetical protein NY603_22700 [Bacteroidetes bacterium 56_B9]
MSDEKLCEWLIGVKSLSLIRDAKLLDKIVASLGLWCVKGDLHRLCFEYHLEQ